MIGATALHSVSYSGLWGQERLPTERFIDKAAELGYEAVMLMAKRPHVSVLDYGPEERARLREHLAKRNLEIACIAGYTNFTADLEHADIPHREIQIQHVLELARLARDLGANLVRVFTGYEHPAAGYQAQWKLVVEALRECARRSAEYGVIIGVQNHHDIAADYRSLRDLVETVDEPYCRAIFDAWAPALHGVDLAVAAREMGALTVHTTVANYQIRPRYHYDPALVNYTPLPAVLQAVPIEEGFIDNATFLAELYAAGYRGSVAYEMCSPLRHGGGMETLDRYARGALEFLEKCRRKAEGELVPAGQLAARA